MTRDYNLKITVRNARILNAIKAAGFDSQAEFCRANGLNISEVNAFIAMRKSPIAFGDKNGPQSGQLKSTAMALCECLCALPEDLWAEEQLWATMPRNTFNFDISRDQAQAMMSGNDVSELLEHSGALKLLEILPPRLGGVIRDRVIHEMTLEEIADNQGVTRERVRQMEAQAFRILRTKASSLRNTIANAPDD